MIAALIFPVASANTGMDVDAGLRINIADKGFLLVQTVWTTVTGVAPFIWL